ncbi:unnamed protein product, partial [Effrenium voratum]
DRAKDGCFTDLRLESAELQIIVEVPRHHTQTASAASIEIPQKIAGGADSPSSLCALPHSLPDGLSRQPEAEARDADVFAAVHADVNAGAQENAPTRSQSLPAQGMHHGGSRRLRFADSVRSEPPKARTDSRISLNRNLSPKTDHFTSILSQTTAKPFIKCIDEIMASYVLDRCSDGRSFKKRLLFMFAVPMAFIVLLPGMALFPVLPPFPGAAQGFWLNWGFNFLAHPWLNYWPSRAALELILRGIEERPRIRWIATLAPLAEPAVCLLIHWLASFWGVYPVPYAVLTACIPGLICSVSIAYCFLPTDVCTKAFREFVLYNGITWIFFIVQIIGLLFWYGIFPAISSDLQMLSSIAVTLGLMFFGFWQELVGDYLRVPEILTVELRVPMLFAKFLFSASLLAKAKDIHVVMSILLLDASQALFAFLEMCCKLMIAVGREMLTAGELEIKNSGCWRCKLSRTFQSVLLVHQKVGLREVAQRMRSTLRAVEGSTRESLYSDDIDSVDARLLNQLSRSLILFAVVEMCEIFVPATWMVMSCAFQSNVFGHNRQYFLGFAGTTNDQFLEGIFNNLLSLLVELMLLSAAHAALFRVFAVNLLEFVSVVLWVNFRFWLFALVSVVILWICTMLEHTATGGKF